MIERAAALVEAKVDVVVVDTAHGHTRGVTDTVTALKKEFPGLEIVAGNVGTYEGAADLVAAGVERGEGGHGPGLHLHDPGRLGGGHAPDHGHRRGRAGLREGRGARHRRRRDQVLGRPREGHRGGASSVMIGSLFAGTDESPGELILRQGRSFKSYRGMGSIGAMREGSKDRYFQESTSGDKLVPEGIEGMVPYKGPLSAMIEQLVGGLRAGMGYCGCGTIQDLQARARFVKISPAGLKESHVHDVIITKEAPNYRLE